MIFNPGGHGSKVPVEFQGKGAGKSTAVLAFPPWVFPAKTLLLTYWYYYTIMYVPPMHKACGISVDISVDETHKCCSEKAFHQIAYEGGKLES